MFGVKLKKLRTDKKLTQKQLAKLIGVDRTSVGKYETKNVIPSIDILLNILKVFNCSLDYLLKNENEQKIDLKIDEKLLLDLYIKLDGISKNEVLDYIKFKLQKIKWVVD